MKRVFFTGPVIKVLTVAGVLLAFAGVIYLLAGMPAPREDDRVGPGDGSFSMIKPHDWASRITFGSASQSYRVTVDLRDPRSIEVNQRMFIGQFKSMPDLAKLAAEGYTKGAFAGREAMILIKSRRKEFTWSAVFESEGQWFDLIIVLPGVVDVPNSEWGPFLRSFRAKPAATTNSMNKNESTTKPPA